MPTMMHFCKVHAIILERAYFITLSMLVFVGIFIQQLLYLTLTFWGQCYKTFYVRNLRIFVIS